jgi:hypothetical protein
MAEIVWLEECLKWERWVRRQRQTLEQLRTPLPAAAPTQQPTTPTSVCVFDPDPSGEPLLLWPGTPKPPTPPRSAVVLNWPKAPRRSTP